MKTPHDYLNDHEADHPDDVIETASDLIDEWDEWRRGRSPSVGAAMCLYAAYLMERDRDDRPRQVDIADEFGVSPVGIRDNLKDLER